MCILGDRVLVSDIYFANGSWYCTKEKICSVTDNNNLTSTFICPLYNLYCRTIYDDYGQNSREVCDNFWTNNKITTRKAFPGFAKSLYGIEN